jgi:hypothetical protein
MSSKYLYNNLLSNTALYSLNRILSHKHHQTLRETVLCIALCTGATWPQTGSPNGGLMCFYSVSSCKCQDNSTSHQGTTASICILTTHCPLILPSSRSDVVFEYNVKKQTNDFFISHILEETIWTKIALCIIVFMAVL